MPVAIPLQKVLVTNTIQSTFVARTVRTSEPGGVGVINLLSVAQGWGMGQAVPERVKIVPYGATTENVTYEFRVFGWNKVSGTNNWIPQVLVHMSATIGLIPAEALGTSNFLVDTLAIIAGTSNVDVLSSPGSNLPAYMIMKVQGCQYVDFDWDLTGAVNMNALISPVETP